MVKKVKDKKKEKGQSKPEEEKAEAVEDIPQEEENKSQEPVVSGTDKATVAENEQETSAVKESQSAEKKKTKPELSDSELKERRKRTIFVGNVAMETTAKRLQKVFRDCGKIEKIWFRSFCVTEDSKKPQRAKIITKQFGGYKDSKNAYVLYKEESSCAEAKQKLNQVLVDEHHLRVDTCGQSLAE